MSYECHLVEYIFFFKNDSLNRTIKKPIKIFNSSFAQSKITTHCQDFTCLFGKLSKKRKYLKRKHNLFFCARPFTQFISFNHFNLWRLAIVSLLLLLSHFSCVRLCVTPQTAAHQAPSFMGFSRQENWSGVPLLRWESLSHQNNVSIKIDYHFLENCFYLCILILTPERFIHMFYSGYIYNQYIRSFVLM